MYNKYNSRKMLKQRRNIFLDIYFQVRFCTLTLVHVFNYQENHTHFSPWLFWKLKITCVRRQKWYIWKRMFRKLYMGLSFLRYVFNLQILFLTVFLGLKKKTLWYSYYFYLSSSSIKPISSKCSIYWTVYFNIVHLTTLPKRWTSCYD